MQVNSIFTVLFNVSSNLFNCSFSFDPSDNLFVDLGTTPSVLVIARKHISLNSKIPSDVASAFEDTKCSYAGIVNKIYFML